MAGVLRDMCVGRDQTETPQGLMSYPKKAQTPSKIRSSRRETEMLGISSIVAVNPVAELMVS